MSEETRAEVRETGLSPSESPFDMIKGTLLDIQTALGRHGELYEATVEQFKRLTTFFELIKTVMSLSDFDRMLEKIAEETAKAFNSDFCLIRLIEGETLKVRASHGISRTLRDQLTIGLGEGIAGKVAAQGKTLLVDKAEELSTLSLLAKHLTVHTAVSTPLKIGGQVIGTFGLYDKRAPDGAVIAFSPHDAATLEGFASIAATVIDKSILYQKALEQEREAREAKERIEELKEYLEGLIENSANAIVTTDLYGVVTSWNNGAERIYGFSRGEAIGKFLPFVPHFLIETERGYFDLMKRGETLKDIETVRKTKDGRMIDVSLTLSPVKDASGKVIGVCGISGDITEKKRIERDLLRKNTELSRLLFISSAMRGTLELDKLLRMVLAAVTVGDGLGFNRSMLFLIDDEDKTLRGAMAVGPSSHEEAWEIWSRLSLERKDLHAILEDIDRFPAGEDTSIDRMCKELTVSLDSECVLSRCVRERRPFNVADARSEPLACQSLVNRLGTFAYAVVPLISRGKTIGVLWVDNLFSSRPITEHDIEFLRGFTDHMATAMENARLFEHMMRAEQEIENIFESISDMVFFSGTDYTIRKVNKAVAGRFGKPAEELVGRKCFEVFHGMGEPPKRCPHRKTVLTGKPYIEEVEEPHLDGAFLVSSSPLFDKKGELLGTVHIVRDISEIKKLRQRIVSTERMAALGEMAAKVAHEIRNPLLSIGGFARRLEKRLDNDLKEYAKIIVGEVSRLEGILSDTLSYVRSGGLEKKDADIGALIDNVVNLLDPAALERGDVITRTISTPMRVPVDADRFKQALLNVITNAIQATERGTISIRAFTQPAVPGLSVSARPKERSEAVIEVEDSGTGISEENLDRIFDPFFTTRPSGTGLGLSITKRIISEHGGRIDVKSTAGEGTTFRIYLPMEEE
jgi:PAS domain S-box-containing protein